eukprot:1158737-Pelagomonas_calceolata.AAC.4
MLTHPANRQQSKVEEQVSRNARNGKRRLELGRVGSGRLRGHACTCLPGQVSESKKEIEIDESILTYANCDIEADLQFKSQPECEQL